MVSFYRISRSLTSITPVFGQELCCFIALAWSGQSCISISAISPILAWEVDLLFPFFSLLHPLSLLRVIAQIHHYFSFSQLQDRLPYIYVLLLLCNIVLFHFVFPVSPLFPDVIMQCKTFCPLSLVLLSFLRDIFFSFYGHFMWIASMSPFWIFFFQWVNQFQNVSRKGFELLSASNFSCTDPEEKAWTLGSGCKSCGQVYLWGGDGSQCQVPVVQSRTRDLWWGQILHSHLQLPLHTGDPKASSRWLWGI